MSHHAISETKEEKIILGGGCFWCVEAALEIVPGVKSVESGYAGGSVENPTYKQVTSGDTGHAEVVRVVFDPEKSSLDEILDVFWQAHDPTTLNRQGADVGTQYRSIIILEDEAQQRPVVEAAVKKAQTKFSNPIVTEVTGPATFYAAEDYHQDFYQQNPSHPYVRAVVVPKVKKVESFLKKSD